MAPLDEPHGDFTDLEMMGLRQEEELHVEGISLNGRQRKNLLRRRCGKPFEAALSVFSVHFQKQTNQGRKALAGQFSEQGLAGRIGGFRKVSCPGNRIERGRMKQVDGLKKCLRGIGKVRVGKEAVLAPGFQHARLDGMSFSLIDAEVDGPQKRYGQALDDLSGLVRAPVVHKNDLISFEVVFTEKAQRLEALGNPFLFVVAGNDDGNEIRPFCHGSRKTANAYYEKAKAGSLRRVPG